MKNQVDSQKIHNDVPEFVSQAIENIWFSALTEARKEFVEETRNLKDAVDRLRNENSRLYKENNSLKDELKKEREKGKEIEKK
jgi:predicted RNase H-like nuclease (RuvC/YqgF family)